MAEAENELFSVVIPPKHQKAFEAVRDEKIAYFGTLQQVLSENGAQRERILLLTNKTLFLCTATSDIIRFTDIVEIISILLGPRPTELGLRLPMNWDMVLHTTERDTIVKRIQSVATHIGIRIGEGTEQDSEFPGPVSVVRCTDKLKSLLNLKEPDKEVYDKQRSHILQEMPHLMEGSTKQQIEYEHKMNLYKSQKAIIGTLMIQFVQGIGFTCNNFLMMLTVDGVELKAPAPCSTTDEGDPVWVPELSNLTEEQKANSKFAAASTLSFDSTTLSGCIKITLKDKGVKGKASTAVSAFGLSDTPLAEGELYFNMAKLYHNGPARTRLRLQPFGAQSGELKMSFNKASGNCLTCGVVDMIITTRMPVAPALSPIPWNTTPPSPLQLSDTAADPEELILSDGLNGLETSATRMVNTDLHRWGGLKVDVVAANNLPGTIRVTMEGDVADTEAFAEVFVEQTRDSSFTRTAEGTVDPFWGEFFTFHVPPPPLVVRCTVYDNSATLDPQVIGYVKYEVDYIETGEPRTLQLQPRPGYPKEAERLASSEKCPEIILKFNYLVRPVDDRLKGTCRGKLQLNVRFAQGLNPRMKIPKLLSVYCNVRGNGFSKNTPVDKGCNPSWEHVIEAETTASSITLSVWDENPLSKTDNFLGQAELEIAKCTNKRALVLHLKPRIGMKDDESLWSKSRNFGTLSVFLTFTPESPNTEDSLPEGLPQFFAYKASLQSQTNMRRTIKRARKTEIQNKVVSPTEGQTQASLESNFPTTPTSPVLGSTEVEAPLVKPGSPILRSERSGTPVVVELQKVGIPKSFQSVQKFNPLQGRDLYYFANVTKVNHRGKEQDRALIITGTTLYSCTPKGEIQRKVLMSKIEEIVIDEISAIALVIPSEYDISFKCNDVINLAVIIKAIVGQNGGTAKVRKDSGDFEKKYKTSKDDAHQAYIPPVDQLTFEDKPRASPESSTPQVLTSKDLGSIEIPPSFRSAFRGLEGTKVFYFGVILKVNSRGKGQERVMVLTAQMMFICTKNGNIIREISLKSVDEVFIDEVECIGIRINGEHDLFMKSPDCVTLAKLFKILCKECRGTPIRISKEGAIEKYPVLLQLSKKGIKGGED